MALEANFESQTPRAASVVHRLIGWLTLVPEAILLPILLVLYITLHEPTPLALLAALLIVLFCIRTIALHLARLALEANRYQQAQALLGVSSLIYPWSADTLAMRGTLALAKGQASEAEPLLRHAKALLPGQSSFSVALSSALIEVGKPFEAAQEARLAIALDPDAAQAYLYLAEAERFCGTESHLIEDYIRTGILHTQHAETQASLQCALTAHLFAERRIAEATLALHGVEALLLKCSAQHQVRIRYLLGNILAAQGLLDRASEQIQGAKALDPHGHFASTGWYAANLQ